MKIIRVKVVPAAKAEQIQTSLTGDLKVWVRGKPVDGEANKAVVSILAKYFKVSQSLIVIKSGHKSRNKLIEVDI